MKLGSGATRAAAEEEEASGASSSSCGPSAESFDLCKCGTGEDVEAAEADGRGGAVLFGALL